MTKAFILSGARTPIGKLGGALSKLTAMQLGGLAISEALRRGGVSSDQVDYVIMGHALQAGQGQATPRQAAIAAGIPMTVPAVSINKVCISGLNALYVANQMVEAGDADVVVTGGMESMSNAPYALPRARFGYKYGNGELLDTMYNDGLYCAIEHCAMGEGTERYNDGAISRETQDEFAFNSHQRALAARDRLSEEIISIDELSFDEGVRENTSMDALANLKGAFGGAGTITAGNASQISDGAAAMVVVSESFLEKLGTSPLGKLSGYGMVAGPDASLLTQPSRAISKAVERSGLSASDISIYEINEAFATVSLASLADLSIPHDIVNVNGGAIALGHPIGMSGARIVLTALYELRRRSELHAAVGLCGGGGQGDGAVISTVS